MNKYLILTLWMVTALWSCGNNPSANVDNSSNQQVNDSTLFHGDVVERVFVSDSKTGELIAEFVGDNYNDDDWDYNEDMGYDPYLGCYTDDC